MVTGAETGKYFPKEKITYKKESGWRNGFLIQVDCTISGEHRQDTYQPKKPLLRKQYFSTEFFESLKKLPFFEKAVLNRDEQTIW